MGIIDRLKGKVGRQEGSDQSGHGASHGGSTGDGASQGTGRSASHAPPPGNARADRWSYGTRSGASTSSGVGSQTGTRGGQTTGTGTSQGSRWTERLTTKGGASTAGDMGSLAEQVPGESAGESFRYLYKKRGPIALLEQRTKEVLFQKFERVELASEDMSLEDQKAYYGKIIDEAVEQVMAEGQLKFPGVIVKRLKAEILDGIIGYGPLQRLLEKEDVTEIMVNGPRHVYIEQRGKLRLTSVKFRDHEQLLQVVQKIVVPVGRRCDEFSPYTDARLPDGSRVNIVIPPISLVGSVITIRRFSKKPYSVRRLVEMGTLTPAMGEFIRACVHAHLNIIVSGGTGSGKTTTLNAISSYLPPGERIITIEDSAELQLQQPHVLSLETRQANVEGKGAVTIRDLLRNALRMIPKRIVVGECRGAEALDMVNALSMGNAGSLSTVHANTPKDMLSRLETMMLMSGKTMTSRLIRELIASAIHIIIQQGRLSDGTRRITHISEVTGIVDGEIQTEDIYRWIQTGVEDDGKVLGSLKATGYIPRVLDKFFEENIQLPEVLFEGAASVSELREGYARRVHEHARLEEARVRAKIALQMALEDVGVAGDLSFDFGLTEERSVRNFAWKDALIDQADATRSGKSWADARTSVSDTSRRPPDRLTRLQSRLKNIRDEGNATGETMSERQQKKINRIFKSAILQEIPRILTFEGASEQFRTRQEEEQVMRGLTESILRNVSNELHWPLPPSQQQMIITEALADMVGLGPIEKFIKDPKVSEVMVNGARMVFVEIAGKLHRTSAVFEDDLHVLHVIRKIIAPLGRRCDESTPMVDARTNQGFRVNAIIPPLALNGPVLTIRKFTEKPYTMEKLIEMGALTFEAAEFLRACIHLGLNVFVSGGTGSGKTTTLNAISSYIPECRIVTIEDAAELRLQQKHVVRLETRPPNTEGRGAIVIRDLLRNALHMGPDRIIVGECRGGEALDMITAMSTGNRGSLSTGHANTPEDLIRRLETMVLMAGVELPLRGIREQIGSALDLIIHQDRFADGSRRITHIAEVVGVVDGAVQVRDIFQFQHQGIDERTGRTAGRLEWTGVWPEFMLDFLDDAIHIPEGIFGPKVQIKQMMLEMAAKRRETDEATLRENLRRSRTYEEAVLLESDDTDGRSNPLMAIDKRATSAGQPAVSQNFSYKTFETPLDAENAQDRETTAEERALAAAKTALEARGLVEVLTQERLDIAGGKRKHGDLDRDHVVSRALHLIEEVVGEHRLFLKTAVKQELAIDLASDIVGLGPIQRLIEDESITEIMINGPRKVFIERAGKLSRTGVAFRDDDHILRIMERILSPLGRRLDANSPLVDARTQHGYRVNGIIAPISAKGPIITIRKFTKKPMRMPDIVRIGSIGQGMADFIAGAVQLKLNIVISGGTGSGKTTTLNAVSAFVPDGERIVTIEDTAELRLQQPHVISLETRQANQEGKGLISIRDLVRNSLHMYPDRILVGECRGGEALDMLQSMNTGNSGAMTTIHASSPRDAMARLETMCLMARTALSSRSLREQISSAIDLIVQVNRFRDGTRKITHITEIRGLKENRVELSDIFTYNRSGVSPEGRVLGIHKATGYLPSFLLRFFKEDVVLPEDVFGEGVPLSKVYERLTREHEVKDVRERNRRALRTRWGLLAERGSAEPIPVAPVPQAPQQGQAPQQAHGEDVAVIPKWIPIKAPRRGASWSEGDRPEPDEKP